MTRTSFSLLTFLSASKRVVASRQITQKFSAGNDLPVYGAIAPSTRQHTDNESEPSGTAPVSTPIFAYGGCLISETGLDIFIEACRIIAKDRITGDPIRIMVSGFGCGSAVADIAAELNGPRIQISWRGELSVDEYELRISDCTVGLCLKLPGTSIGDSTFPSKVIEIVSREMLLLTTPVSDVPYLFSTDEAVFLSAPYAESLARSIVDIADNWPSYEGVAVNGSRKGGQLFGDIHVGTALGEHIWRISTSRT